MKIKNQIQKVIFTFFKIPKRPFIEIRSNKNCVIQSIRKITYNQKLIPNEDGLYFLWKVFYFI